jgi:hypothetical protein
MGSRVSRSTSLTSMQCGQCRLMHVACQGNVPLSVISAKVKLADLCKSMLSEYTSVLNARRGSPEKKSVSARWEDVLAGAVRCADGWVTMYIFQEAQEIGDGFSLAVCQHRVINAVL